MIKLYDFQRGRVGNRKAVALYWDMGLGKTYGGLDRARQFGDDRVLVVCQKSKIQDWIDAIKEFSDEEAANLRKEKEQELFMKNMYKYGVVNYDLLWKRRDKLKKLNGYTLILDESSLIKNPRAKRTKAVFKLNYEHLVLLSGTPCSGKYEELVTQCNLLGWGISADTYIERYTVYRNVYIPGKWDPIRKFIGYKNVRELKTRLKENGADFKLSQDYIDLPQRTFTWVRVDKTSEYNMFEKSLVLKKSTGETITADTPLVKLLRLRQLCNSNKKCEALSDLIEGTDDRLVIFYNFNEEKEKIMEVCKDKPLSFINGEKVDLSNYKEYSNSVTICQYQAGAYGHNLQLANKMIFYSPPLSCEQFEQAQKRIHRIGQKNPCFYWKMETSNSIEKKIYKTLEMRQDYTMKLFASDYKMEEVC